MEKTTVLMKATQTDGDVSQIEIALKGDAFLVADAFARLVKDTYEKMYRADEVLARAAMQTIADACGYRLVKNQEE